jgi:hypothetical protein
LADSTQKKASLNYSVIVGEVSYLERLNSTTTSFGRRADEKKRMAGVSSGSENRSIFEQTAVFDLLCPMVSRYEVLPLPPRRESMKKIVRLVIMALILTGAVSTVSVAQSPIPTCSPGHCE